MSEKRDIAISEEIKTEENENWVCGIQESWQRNSLRMWKKYFEDIINVLEKLKWIKIQNIIQNLRKQKSFGEKILHLAGTNIAVW